MKPFNAWPWTLRVCASIAWVVVIVPVLRTILPATSADLEHDYTVAFVAAIVTALLPRAPIRKRER